MKTYKINKSANKLDPNDVPCISVNQVRHVMAALLENDRWYAKEYHKPKNIIDMMISEKRQFIRLLELTAEVKINKKR